MNVPVGVSRTLPSSEIARCRQAIPADIWTGEESGGTMSSVLVPPRVDPRSTRRSPAWDDGRANALWPRSQASVWMATERHHAGLFRCGNDV